MPFLASTPNLKRLKAQCNALREEVGHLRERLSACESKLVADLNKIKVKAVCAQDSSRY